MAARVCPAAVLCNLSSLHARTHARTHARKARDMLRKCFVEVCICINHSNEQSERKHHERGQTHMASPTALLVPLGVMMGVRGGTVGSDNALQAGRSRVRFPMVS